MEDSEICLCVLLNYALKTIILGLFVGYRSIVHYRNVKLTFSTRAQLIINVEVR